MIKKWIKTDINNTITDFLNNWSEGFVQVLVPEEWITQFSTRTTDFKLVNNNGVNVVEIKDTVLSATWNVFNELKPKIEALEKENSTISETLENSKRANQEAQKTISDLGELVVNLQTQIENKAGE